MRNVEVLLKQKSLVDQYLKLKAHELSAFHFSSIFLWQDFFDFRFEKIEDSLCIFADQKGASFLYLPPLSKEWQPSVVENCLGQLNKINPRTARIENIEQSELKYFDDSFKAHAKASEYVYKRQDLAELKGNAYKSQRHDIHHFQLHQTSLFRPYEDKDLKACLSLYEDWARNRHDKHEDEIYRAMLEENRIVHELALVYYQQLGLMGYVVEIDQKIRAYSFGYSLNSQTFCVLLEITDVGVTGLSSFIFNRFCANEKLSEYTFINTMDDFCLPYVAASKQAYHPCSKPVSYTLSRNK